MKSDVCPPFYIAQIEDSDVEKFLRAVRKDRNGKDVPEWTEDLSRAKAYHTLKDAVEMTAQLCRSVCADMCDRMMIVDSAQMEAIADSD